jgi:hypothetical protein
VPYDGPPCCSRCGGALIHEDETCPCGGRDARSAGPQRAALSGPLLLDVLRQMLAAKGITPQGTPAEFDRAQREFAGWWDGGGSVRAFADHYAAKRHGPVQRSLSWRAAMLELRRRYDPGP